MGPIPTLLQHTPNEDTSIQTSAGYLSKGIGSGIAGGGGGGGGGGGVGGVGGVWGHKHPVNAY